MTFLEIVVRLLIIAGAGVMLLSMVGTRKVLSEVGESRYLRAWRTLLLLMGFFFGGYVGTLFLLSAGTTNVLLILVGAVFLFGALFVYLVVRVGYLTINDLTTTSFSKDQLEAKVSERTSLLEQTNYALRQSQGELALARDEALRANRAKSVFLANMSHELRTPLNAILGYSEMVQEELLDSGQTESIPDLQRIYRSGSHLLSLINDILDLSKIVAGKIDLYLGEFPLYPLLIDVVATVRPLAEKNGNTLRYELPPSLGDMHSDQVKLRQILFNLLSNACKFTKNGEVTLIVKEGSSAQHYLFEVADTGIGLTQDEIDRVFEPFTQASQRTAQDYGGTGLGLTITRRFCEMLGGNIDIASEHGVGTTFTVQLPIQYIAPTISEPQETTITSSHDGKVVLIIDDDPPSRDLLQRYLSGAGFQIKTAVGGQQGLTLAQTLNPDIIALDVMMPDIDGWTVLSQLKGNSSTATIPVVIVTMIDDPQKGLSIGADSYVSKPFSKEQLLRVFEKYQ